MKRTDSKSFCCPFVLPFFHGITTGAFLPQSMRWRAPQPAQFCFFLLLPEASFSVFADGSSTFVQTKSSYSSSSKKTGR